MTYLISGQWSSGGQSIAEEAVAIKSLEFSIPFYIVDSVPDYLDPANLPKNLNFLSSNKQIAGIVNIAHNLTVGFVNSLLLSSSTPSSTLSHSSADAFLSSSDGKQCMDDIISITNSPKYRGCDFLIAPNWPKDVIQFLSDADTEVITSK